MPGPTPITATHKVIWHYTVDNLAHKQQMYCEAIPSADPSGFSLAVQSGTPQGFSTVVDPYFTLLAPFFEAAVTGFSSAELWVRVGTIYSFLVSVTTTVAPSGTAAYNKAMGFDIVGKDADNKNLHAYIYEGAFGFSDKWVSLAGQPAGVVSLVNALLNATSTPAATAPWFWRQSRGGIYGKRWLAGVIDTNEKLRRIRGIK